MLSERKNENWDRIAKRLECQGKGWILFLLSVESHGRILSSS